MIVVPDVFLLANCSRESRATTETARGAGKTSRSTSCKDIIAGRRREHVYQWPQR